MKRGFTLIEMLVAITIFSLVVGSVLGMFISAIHSQSKALASQKLLDETSYVMEYMSRSIRMAQKDSDPPTCLSVANLNYENPDKSGDGLGDSWAIKFKNMYGDCQEFFLEVDKLKENKTGYAVPLELTSTDLSITSLQFNLSGQVQPPPPAGDYLQPRVTISMKIQKAGGGPEIKIQTTISQRNLDVQQ